MKVGGIRYGRSYGAESVENAEFARSKRGSSEMNGTKSNLSCALGVSGVAARDVTCESEEDEEEGVEWGKRVCTGYGCLQHTLGMWDDATTRVEEKWCTPYRRSGHFCVLNLKIRRGG